MFNFTNRYKPMRELTADKSYNLNLWDSLILLDMVARLPMSGAEERFVEALAIKAEEAMVAIAKETQAAMQAQFEETQKGMNDGNSKEVSGGEVLGELRQPDRRTNSH